MRAIAYGWVFLLAAASSAMAAETTSPSRFRPRFESPSDSRRKSSAEYWADTGFSVDTLDKTGLLTNKNCNRSESHFHGCLEAIKALLFNADPKLTLKPATPENLTKMISRFGPVVVVRIEKKSVTDQHESASQRFKKMKSEINIENAAYDGIFKEKTKSAIDFSGLYDYAKTVSLRDRGKEAFIAAQAVNAYRAETMDPHSYIVSQEEFQKKMSASETISWIGVEITKIGDQYTIMGLLDGGSAEKAQLRKGDVILKVNDTEISSLDPDQATSRIRGSINTDVRLRVRRKSEEFDITLRRTHVKKDNVQSKIVEDAGLKIGRLRVNAFAENTCRDLAGAIGKMESEGARGLVLDLRGNGGGLLEEGICVSQLFVGRRPIVKIKDLATNEMMVPRARVATGQVTKLPVMVLIDARSASASEVVSGALQDYKRAWLIGERSFGKGTVQDVVPAPQWGYGVLEARTTKRFFRPSGLTNQVQGITPDVTVPVKPNATEDDRFATREGDAFNHALPAIGKNWQQPRPAQANELARCVEKGGARAAWTRSAENEKPDYQLLAAEDALQCLSKK